MTTQQMTSRIFWKFTLRNFIWRQRRRCRELSQFLRRHSQPLSSPPLQQGTLEALELG